MKFPGKPLGLLFAVLALASCGGGGGNGGSFSPPQSGSISLSATTTTLPTNTGNWLPSQHGPNQAEVTITMRNADGSLMTGQTVTASISPVETAAISVLVGDGNDSLDNLYGTFPIKGTNGQATVWVNARDKVGTATLTVSATDPNTSRTMSATLNFTVTSGVGPAPATVSLSPATTAVYLPSSGGNSSSLITTTVLDGGGQFVADPAVGNSGYDNIKFEIVSDSGDATLSSNSVSGPVSGKSVTSHTVKGVARVSFQAGESTPQGPIQIRATADRADNNVSNGIQDPVTATTSVIVSDGKLYSVKLTSPLYAPGLPGITINTISGDVDSSSIGEIPADPDATLSLAVAAEGLDRQGNPVLPGTNIRFGLIDAPVGMPGTADDNRFLLQGVDGNPQEGGNTFTAPGGRFTTAGGGAGPGDALLVFGKAVQGNDDLESAVTVQRINSATNLTTQSKFNLNNTTGTSVDYGPKLPYIIGRATAGNITAQAVTDEKGVAHASLTYTVRTVGNIFAVWAQGDGIDRVAGGPRRVTDIGVAGYPGVAPATITAFPNPLLGNSTQSVTVCVNDAIGIPLRGVDVGFQFNLPSGTGSIDGTAGAGFMGSRTGTDGCVTGQVKTSGLPVSAANGSSGQVVFKGAGATSEPIDFVVSIAALQAAPSAVPVNCSGSQTTLIKVKALGADGSALPGADIGVSCTASSGASLSANPTSGVTGADGTVPFAITASGFVSTTTPVTYGQGQCVFTSTGGSSRSVTVNFFGVQASPQPICGP